MKTINGIVAVIFDRRGKNTNYLLLHRVLNWTGWEFPKGRIEENEDAEKTLFRELEEETGLKNLKIIGRLEKKLEFDAGDCFRSNEVFVVKGNMDEQISLEQEIIEHDSFKWVGFDEAYSLLTFPDTKELLELAKSLAEPVE